MYIYKPSEAWTEREGKKEKSESEGEVRETLYLLYGN
jgi:hypothetical protein